VVPRRRNFHAAWSPAPRGMEIYPENKGAASGKPGGFLEISRGYHPRNLQKQAIHPGRGVGRSEGIHHPYRGVHHLNLIPGVVPRANFHQPCRAGETTPFSSRVVDEVHGHCLENKGAASGKPGGFLEISRGYHPRNLQKQAIHPGRGVGICLGTGVSWKLCFRAWRWMPPGTATETEFRRQWHYQSEIGNEPQQGSRWRVIHAT